MNLGISAEQQELREAVRRFLAERAPLTRVRELMETTDGTDPDVWRQVGTQLDLPGIAVPEEYGGVGEPGAARAVLDRTLDVAAIALAAEQLGGAQRALDMAVQYARVRRQFGRPIGSFQAIKHRCADLLLEVESLRSAVGYAAAAVAAGSAEVPVLASLLKAYASEVYSHVAGENIQIHGGIGFTWEHDAHLHLKRAKASELFLGDADRKLRPLAGKRQHPAAEPSDEGLAGRAGVRRRVPRLG